jgi:general secretion pathway protein A
MYESFFSLQEKPFALTPNPRFLFLSKTHNEVYAHLIYGIESRAGFVLVTGEVGTGKTTILRTLLSQMDRDKYRTAFIFNPKLTAFELLRNINREFGVADDATTNSDLIHALNAFLLSENDAGRTPILIIDEAQNLSGEVLEQIRLLSNLETESDKLIQIVLVGQPELQAHLSDHSLRQLNQRIAVRYQLQPLNRDETRSYILHRIKIAGRPDGGVFADAALKEIFHLSDGVPRRINLLCDRALLTAFSDEHAPVNRSDVRQAARELNGLGEEFSSNQRPWLLLGVAALVLLLVAAVALFRFLPSTQEALPQPAQVTASRPAAQGEEVNQQPPLTGAAQQTTAAVAVRSQGDALPAQAQTTAPTDRLLKSCNALLKRWDAPALADGTSGEPFDFDREFAVRGFNLARLAGSFSELRSYNVPLLLPLSDEQGGGYLALLSQSGPDRWRVAPAFNGRTELRSDELEQIGLNVALIPWIDFASIGYVAVPGSRGENVRRLQFLLGLTGCLEVPTNGRYNPASIDCIKSFQREHGLVVDGLVGPRTLIMLYQAAGAYDVPRLS